MSIVQPSDRHAFQDRYATEFMAALRVIATPRRQANVLHCERGDLECRRKQRQAVLHWAYDARRI